jgi:hypothetical protein
MSSKMVTPCYLTFVDVGKWMWVRWLTGWIFLKKMMWREARALDP